MGSNLRMSAKEKTSIIGDHRILDGRNDPQQHDLGSIFDTNSPDFKDLRTILNDLITLINAKYSLPQTGIPMTDLSDDIQDLLQTAKGFRGVVDSETSLPLSDNTKGDFYVIASTPPAIRIWTSTNSTGTLSDWGSVVGSGGSGGGGSIAVCDFSNVTYIPVAKKLIFPDGTINAGQRDGEVVINLPTGGTGSSGLNILSASNTNLKVGEALKVTRRTRNPAIVEIQKYVPGMDSKASTLDINSDIEDRFHIEGTNEVDFDSDSVQLGLIPSEVITVDPATEGTFTSEDTTKIEVLDGSVHNKVNWGYKYEGSVLPNLSTPAWTKTIIGSSGVLEEIVNGSLYHATSISGKGLNYSIPSVVQANKSFLLEFKVKFNSFSGSGGYPFYVSITDGKNRFLLSLFIDRISYIDTYGYEGATFSVPMTEWHTFRLVRHDVNVAKLYMDSASIMDIAFPRLDKTLTNRVEFGIAGSATEIVDMYLQYLYYSNTGDIYSDIGGKSALASVDLSSAVNIFKVEVDDSLEIDAPVKIVRPMQDVTNQYPNFSVNKLFSLKFNKKVKTVGVNQ